MSAKKSQPFSHILYARWADSGVIEVIFNALTVDADMQDLSFDNTSTKVRHHTIGEKRAVDAETNQGIGVSRSGKNTKIHALFDGHGNPVNLRFAGGNVHDSDVSANLCLW